MDQSVKAQEARRYGLIIDGTNVAKVSREQIQCNMAGHLAAIVLTIIRPIRRWQDFEKAMAYLGDVLNQIDEIRDVATIARSTAGIKQAQAEGRLAIIMGSQNSTFIESDLSLLTILQRLGFRVLMPCYNDRNRFGDGATVPKDEGLTELGRQWVYEMNRLGMVIDLSHCGHRTSADAIAESAEPVIFSHANALALCNSPRNKPDDLIRAIADKGGVTGACCWAPLLKHATRPSIEDFFDQVDYITNLAGIEHVSFASDLTEGRYASPEEWDKDWGPNGIYPTVTGILGDWYTFDQQYTKGYESLAHTTRIWDGLLARGYSEDDVEKIMGGNLLRVFHQVWGV